MKIYKEIDLSEFEPWAGAKTNFELLSANELAMLQSELEDTYPDGIDETTVNDILWFEDEWIANIAGYDDYETFFDERSKKENV